VAVSSPRIAVDGGRGDEGKLDLLPQCCLFDLSSLCVCCETCFFAVVFWYLIFQLF
jgi:hypothetical protein